MRKPLPAARILDRAASLRQVVKNKEGRSKLNQIMIATGAASRGRCGDFDRPYIHGAVRRNHVPPSRPSHSWTHIELCVWRRRRMSARTSEQVRDLPVAA